MKKIHFPITIMLLALYTSSNSQLNYGFSSTTATYVSVTGGTTPRLIARTWGYGQTSLTSITDLSGRLPRTKIIQVSNGETIVQLKVEQRPAGTYLLKILSAESKKNSIKKFVKE